MSDLVDSRQAAQRFGVAHETFRTWAYRRQLAGFPPPVSGSRRNGYRWKWSDLLDWGIETKRLDVSGTATVRER